MAVWRFEAYASSLVATSFFCRDLKPSLVGATGSSPGIIWQFLTDPAFILFCVSTGLFSGKCRCENLSRRCESTIVGGTCCDLPYYRFLSNPLLLPARLRCSAVGLFQVRCSISVIISGHCEFFGPFNRRFCRGQPATSEILGLYVHECVIGAIGGNYGSCWKLFSVGLVFACVWGCIW